MTPQQLVYRSLGNPTVEAAECLGVCCLCGSIDGRYDRKPFIKEGFTNLDYLRAADSSSICPACASMFTLPKLRQSSWIASGGDMIWLKREHIWDHLWSPPEPPFAMYVTTSYKKHGSFKSRVNYSADRFFVQFEEVGISFSRKDLRQVADALELLYSVPLQDESKAQPISFFSKNEIAHGNYNQGRIRRFGIVALTEAEAVIRPVRSTPAFGLLMFALNKKMLHREGIDWKQKKELMRELLPEITQETLF